MKEFCVTLFTTLELWKSSSSELHYQVHFSECTFRLHLWCIRDGLRWYASGELSYEEIQLLRESPRQTANYIVNKLVRILTRKIEGIG